LADFFSDIPVTTVNVETLHLKCVLTMIDVDTFIIGNSAAAQSVRNEIEAKCKFGNFYKFIEVEDDKAANVMFLNGKIYYPAHLEDIYINNEILKNEEKYALPNSEFEKIDGSVTCRSVLF
jgi:N-dimethylarginine dimethylaminohydrolase